MLCDIMFTLSCTKVRTFFHMIFGHICVVRPAIKRNVAILSHAFWSLCYVRSAVKQNVDISDMIFEHVCDVQQAVKQNVDILSHDLWTHL
jgi:hypothetical protein